MTLKPPNNVEAINGDAEFYGYIHKEDKFFFLLNVIDVFDRTLIDYHMGLSCDAKDATATLRRCLVKRDLFNVDKSFPVVRTDNSPQFISNLFNETCEVLGIHHERIPVRTPNKNAHIECFHRILEDECFSVRKLGLLLYHLRYLYFPFQT